ncbi:MAG: HD domain-containing protein [Alphaproteobacteria bacterium]|nr:HD domain-containing protein [Alphaproteobacteria bacterium]
MQKETGMQDDLINFKKFYNEAVQKVPTDSFYRQSVDHKYRHSIDVLHFGKEVLQKTPELAGKTPEFRKVAQQALLFHDVGRFEELVRLYEVEKNNGDLVAASKAQNHGIIGYDLLKDDERYNDMRILFAVRWHGQMPAEICGSEMYQAAQKLPQFTEITEVLRLVRDADKLANLHTIKEQDRLRKDIFYLHLSPEALNAPISEDVKAQFFAGQVVLTATLHSFADRIMQVISWIYDYNYTETKNIFKKHQFADYLLQNLAQYHHNADDIAKIRAEIAQKMQ